MFLYILKTKIIFDTNIFTIEVNKYSRFEKTGLIPLPTPVISGSNEKRNMFKKCLSPELNKLHTVIESV